MAVNQCGFIPLVSFGRDDKLANYTMKLLVNKESAIRKVEDIKGNTIALTHTTSNSGWKAPLLLLRRDFDLRPIVDYDVVYTGNHSNSIDQLAKGEQQAISVASDELQRAEEKGVIKKEDYRVLFESTAFCNNTFGCPYNLHPDLVLRIKHAMLELDWGDELFADTFASLGASQFVEVTYIEDFKLIREIDNATGTRTRALLAIEE